MKVSTLLFFVLVQLYSFSQSLEERERISAEFERRSDIEIELYPINSSAGQLDSIQMKSDYLRRNNINPKILGFRISGIDKNGEVVFFKWLKNNIITAKFNEKTQIALNVKKQKSTELR
ncbi:MAG: hypothetical protein ABJO12_09815 [Flavobacteriaceae bacterium]